MEDEQETHEEAQYEEETNENNVQLQPPQQTVEQGIIEKDCQALEEEIEEIHEQVAPKNFGLNDQGKDRSNFIHGLAVGLGIGCISTFVIVWISVFFTPRLPSAVTYENLLSIFIYPLIYLLAVGLIALTAGIVREYYAVKSKF
jgi:hypothetical protein